MTPILLISNYAAPYKGNFIPSLESIEQSADAPVHFAFPDAARALPWIDDWAASRHVLFLPASFFSKHIDAATITLLRRYIRAHHIAVLHSHFIEGNPSLFLLRRLLPSVRFVANLHNHYIPSGRLGQFRAFLFRHTYDCVIGDSPSVSLSAEAIRIPKRKIVTILNSIRFSRLDDYTDLGWRKGYDGVVLMFGFPWHRKGVDVVARAVQQLHAEGLNIRLAIAQSGMHDLTLAAVRDTLGTLPDWVLSLPPTEQLSSYYHSADIFVSAGREEGLSYSPIEAAYCACDVVCSEIPGNPCDIPEIGLYPVEDVAALASLLRDRFALSEQQKRAHKSAQRTYVLSRYDLSLWTQSVLQTYRPTKS